jgi:hypothetical protein
MNLDLGKEFSEKQNKYNYDLANKNIKEFYNNVQYKTRLLNIDSKYRNKIPKNIYKSLNMILPNNPIFSTNNSNLIKINYPNHTFSIGDRIIVQNVEGNSKILSNCLYFFVHFQYLFVHFPNHNINVNYLDYIDYFKCSINIINDIGNKTVYGNMPVNATIGIFDIYLPSIINNDTPLPLEILQLFNAAQATDLDKDYFAIKLPFSFNTSEGLYYVSTDVFKISILNIGGIPIQYINSDYPINYQRYQGFQEIINIDQNFIYIQSAITASSTVQSGGNKMQIMTIVNTLEGYPDANSYNISLKHGFNNVVRIELVSTEIPYIDFLITKYNNKLYWKHYDDGNYEYQILIPEGSYDGSNLISKITTLINQVTRLESTIEDPVYNIFEINLNTFTQEITFTPYKNNKLPNSLTASLVDINNIKYVKLSVYHPSNLVSEGDTIEISGATKIGTIVDAIYINASLQIYEINIIEQTYSVLLAPLSRITNATNIDITGNGGPSTVIKTRAKVSFLFNKSDTIGDVLGFKNVGEDNAITPYNTIVSNLNSYIESTNLNQVGNIDISRRLLNLTGSNFYILMYINNYECIINNSNQETAFAKILLTGSPGDILFNTFINYPLEFDFPVSTLTEISIKFTYPDGKLVDFRNIDHSFTLKIMEELQFPTNTNINSKNTSFIETVKEAKIV